MNEIRAHTGSQFCPRCVEALEHVCRDRPEVLGLRLGQLRAVAG